MNEHYFEDLPEDFNINKGKSGIPDPDWDFEKKERLYQGPTTFLTKEILKKHPR